jgi:hypothetical protein
MRTKAILARVGEIQARQFDLVSAGTLAVDRLVGDAFADDDALLHGPWLPQTCLRSARRSWSSSRAMSWTGQPGSIAAAASPTRSAASGATFWRTSASATMPSS